MKKTYIEPTMKVAKITPVKLLADSGPKQSLQYTETQGDASQSILVKEQSVWDDEW